MHFVTGTRAHRWRMLSLVRSMPMRAEGKAELTPCQGYVVNGTGDQGLGLVELLSRHGHGASRSDEGEAENLLLGAPCSNFQSSKALGPITGVITRRCERSANAHWIPVFDAALIWPSTQW